MRLFMVNDRMRVGVLGSVEQVKPVNDRLAALGRKSEVDIVTRKRRP